MNYRDPIERIYLIGSLRLPAVRDMAKELRSLGFEVFDDWHAAGPQADDIWQAYEQQRGRTYIEALRGEHGRDVYNFDYHNILKCDTGVLMMPAGKSGHLELGFMLGKGRRGYVLFDGEPERWDIMYQFASDLFMSKLDLFDELKRNRK